jgi:hypothetical protein
MIALRLHDVNWLDRRWILQRLPATSRHRITGELRSLRKLNIGNALELYEQLKQRQSTTNSAPLTAFSKHLQLTVSDGNNLTPATCGWLKQSKLLQSGSE